MKTVSSELKNEMREVLENNILNFWLERMTDEENGGYYGRIDGYGRLVPDADKGAILNARILWAFSAAYRVLDDSRYLSAARREKDYIVEHFIDHDNGGVYWSLDCKGRPKDRKKQIYAIGFVIYGMAEYARATGDSSALDCAIDLYRDIEAHAFDRKNNGYIEAMTEEWGRTDDMRLSDKDENMSKTMNTHLHIIEPYTCLYRVWQDGKLAGSLRNLLDVFTGKIINRDSSHLDLFFDDSWNGPRNIISYGHDIEASWLLHETALVLGDRLVIENIAPVVRSVARAADEGLTPDGAMVYERRLDTSRTDSELHWWVQCESIVGHVNLWQHFGDEAALETAVRCWDFVKERLIDRKGGEWYWSILPDGTPNRDCDKAGFWKCPYHNARMCLEIMERDF